MRRHFLLLALLILGLSVPGAAQVRVVGEPEAVTPAGEYFIRPQWSPDGKWLAFTGRGYRGLWVMNWESRQIRQLTDDPGAGYGFVWSPDGRYIACRINRWENRRKKSAVCLIQVATGNKQTLTSFQKRVGLPRWGGDISHLYVNLGGKLQKISTGIASAGARDRLEEVSDLIVLWKHDQIFLRRGTSVLQLTKSPGRYLNPVLSPDGQMVAFEEIGGHLKVIRVDGTGLVDLGPGNRPQWSPDGQWIVCMVATDDGHRYLTSDIYAVRVDGTQRVNLTPTEDRLEMNPHWSPDGRRIAYDLYGVGQIFVMEVEIP